MKCNYKPPKLTREEQQDMASLKSTLPYIDRLQIQWRNSESIDDCEDKNTFNPFYDSEFLISYEGSDKRRMLVELYEDELIKLRNEIDIVLEHMGASVGVVKGV